MASTELDLFVRESLARGASKESVGQTLASAGWSSEQVTRALGAYADVASGVPVPKPRASLSAREAFLYLVLFASLYLAAWHLGSMLFDLLDYRLPDAADLGNSLRDYSIGPSIRFSTASVIIALPLYLWVARLLARAVSRDPLKRLSPVRRWLTYLTLFLATNTLVCDTITLVYNLLGGELTLRFVLKVVVAAVIAGAIFSYYLLDLRRGEDGKNVDAADKLGRPLAIAAIVVGVATIALAISVMGTPVEQRRVRIDAGRVDDLSKIADAVREYRKEHDMFPPDLAALANKPGVSLRVQDRNGQGMYEYAAVDAKRFRLCARFTTDTAVQRPREYPANLPPWAHGAGRQCFTLRQNPGDEEIPSPIGP